MSYISSTKANNLSSGVARIKTIGAKRYVEILRNKKDRSPHRRNAKFLVDSLNSGVQAKDCGLTEEDFKEKGSLCHLSSYNQTRIKVFL